MKHFTIEELTHTSVNLDNTPTPQVIENLERLVKNVLDPLRELYGFPIKVNSGYRSPAVNKAVGGAANSQHMKGEAADITAGSPEANKKLFDLCSWLAFDQCIDEKNYTWIHVSFKKTGNRKQKLHIK